ncbi:phosphonate metabolism protein/1,5-bisphosphokinase (PRPP-forming) PhnN [Nocardia sp. NPDC004711]
MTGVFIAVIGPSGAGKDSILDYARDHYSHNPDGPIFVTRTITRPAGPGEDHTPTTEHEFAAAHARGEFAITWRAHGLQYGIPTQDADAVRGGAVVIANTSRAVLAELPQHFTQTRIVRITVSDDVRRTRLAARAREDAADAAARILRADPAPDHPVDLDIVNDGTLENAGNTFIAFIDTLL